MKSTEEPAAEEKTLAEVYKSLHTMAKVIRAHRGTSIADVFQKYAEPCMKREYKKVLAEMNAEVGGEA